MTTHSFPPHIYDLLQKRYFMKGDVYKNYYKSGIASSIEDWDMLSSRVGDTIGNTKREKAAFAKMVHDLVFLPNSPTLFGAGIPGLTMSACYVLEVTDSIPGWAETIRLAMLTQCMGGGCGFPMHKLRPHGNPIKGKPAKAAGPIEFMHCWNEISHTLRQAVRNGANMALLDCRHPELEAFIECKKQDGVLPAFNISVGITDEFMDALHAGEDFALRWPWNGGSESIVKWVHAQDIWDKICHYACLNGEPGMVFIDEMNRNNPWHKDGNTMYCNPCSESSLFENSACNLGSINLTKFVKHGYSTKASFDISKFMGFVEQAYTFLDNLIDKNTYPDAKIRDASLRYRQIGLGIMGLADVFLMLGIPYGTKRSVDLTATIFESLQDASLEANRKLAHDRGAAPFFFDLPAPPKQHLRNFTMNCVAPTGSISQIACCSQGIEPHQSFDSYTRIISDKKHILDGPKKSHVAAANVTAMDINCRAHIEVTAAAQKFVDMSISKTINLPEHATEKDVSDAYSMAHAHKLKGVTVYRNNSRANQVIQTGPSKPEQVTKPATLISPMGKLVPDTGIELAARDMIETSKQHFFAYDTVAPIKRPNPLIGMTKKYNIGCGYLYVTVNYSEKNEIVELFIRPGKYGGCHSNVEALGRLASLAFRAGVKIDEVIDQLSGIKCLSCVGKKGMEVKSCSDAIAKTIILVYKTLGKKQIKITAGAPVDDHKDMPLPGFNFGELGACINSAITEEQPVPSCDRKTVVVEKLNICPFCGERGYYPSGGCWTCKICGESKCG